MHESVRRFLVEQVAAHARETDVRRVLDCGALDVNGSAREYVDLERVHYTPVDMRHGRGVGVVADCHRLPFRSGAFDMVLSLSHLEHDTAPWISVREMRRVLRTGGWLVVSVPGFGWPRHDFPSDYWRFSAEAIEALVAGYGLRTVLLKENLSPDGPDVFYIGEATPQRKRTANARRARQAAGMARALRGWAARRAREMRLGARKSGSPFWE
jgi:SAM-dependent methyltransferase